MRFSLWGFLVVLAWLLLGLVLPIPLWVYFAVGFFGMMAAAIFDDWYARRETRREHRAV